MTEQQQNDKSNSIAREWFKNHVAAMTTFKTAEGDGMIIKWRRPDTSNYAMTFMLLENRVFVTGDVGDAIYGFGCQTTVDNIKRFDWHYFVNKCCASETGRDYTMKIPGMKHPVTNVRAIGHFVGLKMAIEQLNL